MANITVYRNADTILNVEVVIDSARTLDSLKMSIKSLRGDADDAIVNGVVVSSGALDASNIFVATGFFTVSASDVQDFERGSYEYGGVAILDNGTKIALDGFNGRCWIEDSGVEE